MREPHSDGLMPVAYRRITPAHAGTTLCQRKPHPASRDHPRSCGNHFFKVAKRIFRVGSPPLMREPRGICPSVTGAFGITPAHAGTTIYITQNTQNTQDHPRSCGNHYASFLQSKHVVGSPPLMREPLSPCSKS